MDPVDAEDYEARAIFFARQARFEAEKGTRIVSALPSKAIVTGHASWVYLAGAIGLTVAGTLEPVPGVPPNRSHLRDLAGTIRERDVRLLLQEPYLDGRAAELLSRETGVRVLKVSASCEDPSAGSYLEHLDRLLDLIAASGGAGM